MRYKILFLLGILAVLSLNIISAEIMLSQPQAFYNLGDNLDIKATVKTNEQTTGFLELNLRCENESKNFYREPLNLKANEQRDVDISLLLTKNLAFGNCDVEASFLQEKISSQKFIISDKINVVLTIENLSIGAGREIIVRGNARKENGKNVNGFLDLSSENTDIRITREVVNGSFSTSFSFPENTKSGNYFLKARVYEKLGEEETNNGEAKITIFVEKIAKKVEIAMSNQNFKPGETIIFKPVIYDQANEEIEGDIIVKWYDANDKLFFQKLLKSGEEKELYLETNSSPGYWKVKAIALGLESERAFYVEELEKAKFEIKEDTLTITNIGNVPYKNTVQISINDELETRNVELDLGESRSFKLEAPEGDYKISVSDGMGGLNVDSVGLTGNIIGVTEIKNAASIFTKYSIVWLFLVVVLGMFIFVISRKVMKKKFYGFPAEKNKQVSEKVVGIQEKIERKQEEIKKDMSVVPISGKLVERAEHTVVLDGRKESGSLIAIKIRDLNSIRKLCSETINNILRTIIENKGAIYETSEYLIGIFSSQTTKTFENDILTVRTARKVEEILNQHNKKFRVKINFGISLNSGELILKKDSGMLKFTAIGNSLNLAKRIAELANNELLLSENLQKKVMNEVKSEKETRQGISVYRIGSISDRERYSGFIQGFLDREKAGNKQL